MAKVQLLGTFFLLLATSAHTNTSAVAQTKTKLMQLETKISNLKHTLNNAQDKNAVLNHELAATEKQISVGIHQLRNLQQKMASTQHKIRALQLQVNLLDKQLHEQQDLLAKHLRARYTMGEYQPLTWLLNQNTPDTTSRLLTFYQYIVQSRQQIIDHTHETQKNLTESQDKLQKEITAELALQQQLSKHQQKLEQNKLYNIAILNSLNKEIHSKQQMLTDYQRNKDNLSNVLKSLVQQSILQTQRTFMSMRKKLPRPLAANNNSLQKINQGVVFFAPEGARINAVYPGKVVFSDWLNGYGLLLIVDHGRGFMTLYAHNQSLFKHKGEFVDLGEQIATVGHSGGLKKNGLYFEIRQRGKAIPPLKWLS